MAVSSRSAGGHNMRYLLNQVLGSEYKVDNLLDLITDLSLHYDSDYITAHQAEEISKQLNAFEADPEGVVGEFFHFIATAPNELTEQAKAYILAQNDDDEITETEAQYELSQSVVRMGKELDKLAKSLTLLRPWRYAYQTAVDVTRVWRTEDGEVIGEPSPRKVQIDAIPRTLVGIVTADNGIGRPRTMLSVSGGQYKGEEKAREDYLIDLTRIYEIGFGTGDINRPRNVSDNQVTVSLYKAIHAANPLLYEICMMAMQLSKLGALKDPTGIYKNMNARVHRALNPDDYKEGQLGGWA